MSASESKFVRVSLFVMFVAATSGAAAAMEQGRPGASAATSPALTLPTFLDEDRLPALQEAWRAREGAPEVVSEPLGAQVRIEPAASEGEAEGAAMSAARAAMRRVGEASRQAPAVREAAEELSRRFSAISEPAEAGPAPSSVVVSTAIAEGADADRADEAAEGAVTSGAGAGNAAPVTTTSALPEAAMRPNSARIDEGPAVAVAPKSRKVIIPPLPLRAADAKTDADQRPARNTNSVAVARPEGPPVTAARREVFPPYMRAFGWDSQP